MGLLSSVIGKVLDIIITPVAEGSTAPPFTMADAEGRQVSLSDFAGKWVVLYFYPMDDTPGCTKQACEFRDRKSEVEAAGAVVLGVSVDDAASHQRFAARYHLTFPLLVDAGAVVSRAYGVATPLKAIAMRVTFVIDPSGVIRKVIKGIDAGDHPAAALAAITKS